LHAFRVVNVITAVEEEVERIQLLKVEVAQGNTNGYILGEQAQS
jgi:hypothetical protein